VAGAQGPGQHRHQRRGAAGDGERARDAYERAIEVDPGYGPAQESLDNL